MSMRIGLGFDIHELVDGRPLILGGIQIPHHKGLSAHSDGDALLHAISDACLGALALGDIGTHFPDTDMRYKDANSTQLLSHVIQMIHDRGWIVSNIDSNIIAQWPKMKPFISQMRECIASLCEVDMSQISVKARTHEKMDAVGHEKAISTQAIVLLAVNAMPCSEK